MKKIYRIGIIGTGAIAIKHAQAIESLSNAELIGLFNPNPNSASKAKDKFSAPVFSNWEAFVSLPDLEVICICTPSGLHLDPALKAIEAGKHIFVEKPICLYPEELEEIAALKQSNQKEKETFENVKRETKL